MKKKSCFKKRVIGVALVLLTVFTSIPMNVYAVAKDPDVLEDANYSDTYQEVPQTSEDTYLPDLQITNSGLELTSGDYTYTLSEENATITKYNGSKETVTVSIPEKLDGHSVVSIGNGAFVENWSIKAVVIPSSVTSIGDYAFGGCSSLTTITFPKSLTTIGDQAFGGCSSLTAITFPESLTTIGDYAFAACDSLTTITFPESLIAIGDYAFSECGSLTTITFPELLTTIEAGAFYGCPALTTITFPESLTTIGDWAFGVCSSLTTITFPESLTTIGNYAFASCYSLTTITFPKSLTTIGVDAFNYCYSLTTITFPESLTTIGVGAFSSCRSLEVVQIDKSVTEIGNKAFYGCEKLSDVYYTGTEEEWEKILIGDSNQQLLDATIHYNNTGSDDPGGDDGEEENPDPELTSGDYTYTLTEENATIIKYNGSEETVSIPEKLDGHSVVSIGDRTFAGNSSIKSVVTPSSVTTIGEEAFSSCSSLEVVQIDKSVTEIGNKAFYGCEKLSDVYYTGTEEEWEKILIGNNNQQLLNANIHYNNSGSDDPGGDDGEEENPDPELTSGDYTYTLTEENATITKYNGSEETLSIPEKLDGHSVVSIGDGAFAGNSSIKAVVIPSSVTSIGDSAFDGCSNIKILCYINSFAHKYAQKNNIPYELIRSTEFIMGQDQWGFSNGYAYFGNEGETYYIKQDDYNDLIRNLSEIEIDRVERLKNKKWGGSCYGMSAVAILSKAGIIEPNSIQSGREYLYSITKSNNDDVESCINFYFLQQRLSIPADSREEFMTKSTSVQLRDIEEKCNSVSESGIPVFLIFFGVIGKDEVGHAVVAYGVEHGEFTYNGKRYDSRILVYDCNYPEGSEYSYLWYNTGSEEWCIPNYSWASKLGWACNDISVIDYVHHKTAVDNYTNYTQLDYNGSADGYYLEYEGSQLFIDGSTDMREEGLVTYCDIGVLADGSANPGTLHLTLPSSTDSYSVIPLENKAGEFTLYYENAALSITCETAERIDFNADKSMSATGVSGEYSADLIFNEGYHSLPWYKVSVSGTDCGDISLKQTEEGIIIKGSNLDNVDVTVKNDDETRRLQFSTDKDSVLLTKETSGGGTEPIIKDNDHIDQSGQKDGIHIVGLKDSYEYTGAKIIPDIKVYDYSISDEIPLVPGTDYTVKYKDNVKPFSLTNKKATVIVTGKGNYAGKGQEGYFTIEENSYIPEDGFLDLKGAKIAKIAPVSYNTQAHYPDFTLTLSDKSSKTYTYSKSGYYVESGTTNRIKAKVAVSNNINKGTATILITGAMNKNKATTVKNTFKITALDISSATVTANPATYAVKGAVPSMKVMIKVGVDGTDVTKTLIPGIDYTAKYTSNKKAGTKGIVKVMGKGNYVGKVADANFDISTLAMTDLKIAVTVYEGVKADKVKATVLDPQGNALKASQYTVEVSKNEQFSEKLTDKLKAGEDVYVRAVAKDATNLTKETKTKAVKVKVGKNFAKAQVKLKKDLSTNKTITKTYTGRSIELSKDEIDVTMKGVSGEITYEIVGYTNNIKKGTATAILQGTGEYTGTKTVKFMIVAKNMTTVSFDSIKTDIKNFINGLLN